MVHRSFNSSDEGMKNSLPIIELFPGLRTASQGRPEVLSLRIISVLSRPLRALLVDRPSRTKSPHHGPKCKNSSGVKASKNLTIFSALLTVCSTIPPYGPMSPVLHGPPTAHARTVDPNDLTGITQTSCFSPESARSVKHVGA